jgi:hypothetical protein
MGTISGRRMGIAFPLEVTLALLDVWSGPSSLKRGWLSPYRCSGGFRALFGNKRLPLDPRLKVTATEPCGASYAVRKSALLERAGLSSGGKAWVARIGTAFSRSGTERRRRISDEELSQQVFLALW